MKPKWIRNLAPIAAMALAAALSSGCARDPQAAERDDLEKIMVAVSWAGHSVSHRQIKAARGSSEMERALMRHVMIDPITRAGYDPDRLIDELFSTYREPDLSDKQSRDIANFLRAYASSSDDLVRLNLISATTGSRLSQFQFASSH